MDLDIARPFKDSRANSGEKSLDVHMDDQKASTIQVMDSKARFRNKKNPFNSTQNVNGRNKLANIKTRNDNTGNGPRKHISTNKTDHSVTMINPQEDNPSS